MTFGIPSDVLPVSKSGVASVENHKLWLERRQAMEASSSSFSSATALASLASSPILTAGDRSHVIPSPYRMATATSSDRSNLTSTTFASMDEESGMVLLSPEATGSSDNEPRRMDVLFGRGKGIQNRPGNARFRHIVEMHATKYDGVSKAGKVIISKTIVDLIHESTGRFLKPDKKGGWVEVSDNEARRKVAHAFRARRQGTSIKKGGCDDHNNDDDHDGADDDDDDNEEENDEDHEVVV